MVTEISKIEEVRRLEEQLLQPKVRKSAQDLARLLADDFLEFGSLGSIYGKHEIIESLWYEPEDQATLLDFQARVLAPDVILTTYRTVKHIKLTKQTTYSLRSSVWALREGQWQVVFHQGTISLAS